MHFASGHVRVGVELTRWNQQAEIIELYKMWSGIENEDALMGKMVGWWILFWWTEWRGTIPLIGQTLPHFEHCLITGTSLICKNEWKRERERERERDNTFLFFCARFKIFPADDRTSYLITSIMLINHGFNCHQNGCVCVFLINLSLV